MNDEEKAKLKQLSLERALRQEKHLVICKVADEVYQKCVSQNLNCEDVEALCRCIVSRAKKSPIC